MNKLFDFIVRKAHWLLLVFFELIALSLLFNNSLYHKLIRTSYSNLLLGKIHVVSSQARSYLALREENRKLTEQLAIAELNYLSLKQQVAYAVADTIKPRLEISEQEPTPYSFITATVLSSSTHQRRNIIFLDKGRRDGVNERMGVVGNSGVAGIIASVEDRYSIMIPLLNPDLRLSCSLKRTSYTGTLSWNDPGEPYARLQELSRHASYQKGDTLVTSGYSSVFPPGLFVGTIVTPSQPADQLTTSSGVPLVQLGVDFDRLQFVYIITGGMPISASELERNLGEE